MKITDQNKPISTIPKGVWESSSPCDSQEEEPAATQTTDLQGNGYPKEQKTMPPKR